MANYRRGRINDAVAKELAIALGNVREPKVNNNFVSITRAEVAPDLKYATVYFVLFIEEVRIAGGAHGLAELFAEGNDLVITNRYDFTDLSECRLVLTMTVDGVTTYLYKGNNVT